MIVATDSQIASALGSTIDSMMSCIVVTGLNVAEELGVGSGDPAVQPAPATRTAAARIAALGNVALEPVPLSVFSIGSPFGTAKLTVGGGSSPAPVLTGWDGGPTSRFC